VGRLTRNRRATSEIGSRWWVMGNRIAPDRDRLARIARSGRCCAESQWGPQIRL